MVRQMKTKIYIVISLVISMTSFVLFRGVSTAPSANSPESVTIIAPQQPTSTQTNVTKATQTHKSPKHASDILRAQQDFTEVQYYLLGSVSDPQYANSWSLSKIQTDRAWDLTTGSSDVTVAVIDTGFALSHQELTNSWRINTDEQGTTQSGDVCWTGSPANKQSNTCDDDQNGYIDDWRGYDFYYNDNDVSAGTVNPNGDGTQHATMVSGVIAAGANNGYGSTGIDQNVKIMPLQVFSDNSEAFTSDLVAAVEYAVDNGADVINLSLGSNGYDAVLRSAIQYANNNGVLVVAASGNCALNDKVFCNSLAAPGRMTYPALYDEAFAVGATTSSDLRASYSSYGSQLDIVAPGSSITPLPIYTAGNQTSSYATASGTSFASPLVAGVASLLIAQNPQITVSELKFQLTESADKVSSMGVQTFTTEYGVGRLNAHKATLLGLARTQTNLLGELSNNPRQQANGYIWRAASGNVASDESILVGCRIASGDICSSTAQNNVIYRFWTANNVKGEEYQYIFIKGNALSEGTWSIGVHSREFARSIGTLTK